MRTYEATIAHFFCGSGGGGLGSARAQSEIGGARARFRVLGGIDVDPLACQDFEHLVGAPALCANMATLQPAELQRFLGPRAPDMILTSPPCKGFSALLPKAKASTQHYQDLNQLVLQGLHLALSTWATPPRVLFLENVPRITSRGAELRPARASAVIV
jgi:site-specific DNA-cytosine methylase